MKLTSLCYIQRGGQYLMLHRTVKENDGNHDKWIGVGGKFEPGESPHECVCREALEETGLTLVSPRLRGVITFLSDEWEGEYMFLFTCDRFTGAVGQCDEGVLEWIDKKALYDLQLWEGDKIFLRLLEEDRPFFSLKLRYQGDSLVEANLDGVPIP